MARKPQETFREPPDYRLFYLDGDGKIKGSKPLADCADDEAAIAKALSLAEERRLELYDGCRLVIAIPPKA